VPFLKLHAMPGTSCGIPFTPGQSVREILDATGTRVRSGCNGSGACGLCRIRIMAGDVHGPTSKEQYLIEEGRRARGVRLACQVIPEGDLEIEILSPARKSAWRSLPADAGLLQPGSGQDCPGR
jgi:ferredoxin